MFKRSLISAVDQAVVSGLNFCIGLVLIATVSKPEYGLYVQLFAFGVLLNALSDALVGNAITNMLAREGVGKLPVFLQNGGAFVKFMAAWLSGVAGLMAYGLAMDAHEHMESLFIAGSFSAYAGSLLLREFARTESHLHEKPENVLRLDVIYVSGVFILGALAYSQYGLNLGEVFLVMTLANVISLKTSVKYAKVENEAELPLTSWPQLKNYWQYTRWAVVGVVVGWSANNLFIFVSAQILSLEATAELNAARLLLMPLTLLGVAWGQSNRAKIASLIQQQIRVNLIAFIRKSLFILLATCFLYGTALLLVLPMLSKLGPFAKYGQLHHLLMWWLPYMVLFVGKFTATVILSVFEVYRPMMIMTFISMCLQFVLLMWIPQQTTDLASVIWCLMVAETFELLVMWLYLMPQTLQARGFQRHAT